MKISLIGRVEVEFDDGFVVDESKLVGRQGRLFFAYLVAERGRAVPRDELAEALWGETPPVTWEKALTVLASKLRRLLAQHGLAAPALLTAAFGCYRIELPEGTWVDVLEAATAVEDAESALVDADLDRARERASSTTSLLRRPFLAGENGPWVEAKRREHGDLRERALVVLADANLRAGDASAAADAAEQLITLAPLRESGHRRLMEAQAASGNRAEALATYERCRELLAEELGAYPSPETEAIYRALLEAPASEPADTATTVERSLPAAPLPASRGSDRRRRIGLVAATLLVLAVGGIAVALTRAGGSVVVAPDSVGVIDPERNRVITQVPVGRDPSAVVVGEDAVWVANRVDETLSRIDPADTAARPTTISVNDYPSDLAVGSAVVWVALGTRGAILSVDSAFNTVSKRTPVLTQGREREPGHCGLSHASVTLGRGFVWFACDVWGPVRVNPRGGAAVPISLTGGSIETGTLLEYPDFVDVGHAKGRSLWIVNRTGNSVIEADTVTNTERRTVSVGRSPVAIAVSGETLWVANFEDDTVTRIDVAAGDPAVTTEIPVGDGPVAVAVGEGGVWVANQLGHTVSRIDPDSNEVVATIDVGNEPSGIAAGAGSVWVTVRKVPATRAGHE